LLAISTLVVIVRGLVAVFIRITKNLVPNGAHVGRMLDKDFFSARRTCRSGVSDRSPAIGALN